MFHFLPLPSAQGEIVLLDERGRGFRGGGGVWTVFCEVVSPHCENPRPDPQEGKLFLS